MLTFGLENKDCYINSLFLFSVELTTKRMDPLQAKANYSRVCQLLIDKGGDALRRVLQTKINLSPPPSTLDSLLSAHKKSLQKRRYSVISVAQWKLLYPASAPADANGFDITLIADYPSPKYLDWLPQRLDGMLCLQLVIPLYQLRF